MEAGLRIWDFFKSATRWIEGVLASAILIGVVGFGISSAYSLALMDWRTTDAFYELIYRVLLLAIGLELVRTLVTHNLAAVLELLAFVVARKMLKPDLDVLDILLSVVAFVALLAANRFLLSDAKSPGSPPRMPA
jgi:hypothetical protein